tara:strand:+ start:23 stop:442 length:420 start_codon:yes stop_codon:yes gene_type:complete
VVAVVAVVINSATIACGLVGMARIRMRRQGLCTKTASATVRIGQWRAPRNRQRWDGARQTCPRNNVTPSTSSKTPCPHQPSQALMVRAPRQHVPLEMLPILLIRIGLTPTTHKSSPYAGANLPPPPRPQPHNKQLQHPP